MICYRCLGNIERELIAQYGECVRLARNSTEPRTSSPLCLECQSDLYKHVKSTHRLMLKAKGLTDEEFKELSRDYPSYSFTDDPNVLSAGASDEP